MKHLTLYQYQLENERHFHEYSSDRETHPLGNRLGSASRTLVKSLLKQIRDFRNVIHKKSLRSREIDHRIRNYKETEFQRNYFLRGLI